MYTYALLCGDIHRRGSCSPLRQPDIPRPTANFQLLHGSSLIIPVTAEFMLPYNKAHGNANNTQKISVYSSFYLFLPLRTSIQKCHAGHGGRHGQPDGNATPTPPRRQDMRRKQKNVNTQQHQSYEKIKICRPYAHAHSNNSCVGMQ